MGSHRLNNKTVKTNIVQNFLRRYVARWICFCGSLLALEGAQTSKEPEVQAAPIRRLVVKSKRDGWRKHCRGRVAAAFEGGFCNDLQKAPFAFLKSR